VASSCEHGNEPSGSIKDLEFIEWLCMLWLLKRDWTLRSSVISQLIFSFGFVSDNNTVELHRRFGGTYCLYL
jgi:hypothetical protein